MNYRFLEEKIDDIRGLPQYADCGFDDETLIAFFRVLEDRRGWELVRINPLALAEKFDFRPDDAVSLFLLGAKVGLFAFEWSLLCPRCGCRERTYGSLRALDRDVFRCPLCDAEEAVAADDRLEVSFTMPPSASGEWPDQVVSLPEYWSYFFSTSVDWTGELLDDFARRSAGPQPPIRFVALPRGGKARIRLDAARAGAVGLVTLETHSAFFVRMKDDANRPPAAIDLEYRDSGFDRREAFAPLGPTEIALANRARRAVGCLIGSPDPDFLRSLVAAHPPSFRPFCSGKLLLNHQAYRDLFAPDDLPDDLSLKIDDLTILRADPEGRAGSPVRSRGGGDSPSARRLFDLLAAVARAHRGAIERRAGGSITATFNAPLDGIRAAVRMAAGLEESAAAGEDGGGIRIGLHRGPVVAVKAGRRLDFFGRAMNVVSRLLDLADPGEIRLSEDVMRDETVAAYLRASGYSGVAEEIALPGPANMVTVYSCRR
ncbi:MAG: adenylate/guanylate cyclase domain-containing protein [Spirochaetales bacterium]|nr:adenylate/guanylate cyclase domain-containing protein [Spirochaetales bacterium]